MRLPSPQSELAIQTMKDPYIFDFIPFKTDMLEREIEEALVKDVTKLLLELGTGFAFLGNQYHLNVGGDDFYVNPKPHFILCHTELSYSSVSGDCMKKELSYFCINRAKQTFLQKRA